MMAALVLDEGQQGKFRSNIKAYGLALGFIVLFVWVVVLAASLILYMLGFKVPEILISLEAQISATGYCWLFIDFYYPRKRGEKHYRLLTILETIIGAVLIITGVYNIALANLNVFTYLCLIIGTALIFINVKNWHAQRRL
jgi:hypothetical protein